MIIVMKPDAAESSIQTIVEYIKGQLAFEESRPIDTSNDGVDH